MNAYSTLYITRTKALKIWVREKMYIPPDEELEEFIDDYLKDKLYNCRIIADGSESNDAEID